MTVKISIEGDGLTFKKDITFQKAGQIIAFLGADESLVRAEQGLIMASPSTTLPPIDQSPRDLIIQAKAKTNAQKITVLGQYLADKDGNDYFLIKEVQLQLKKLGEEPANFTRDLKAAEAARYIYQIPPKKDGKYNVTEAGKDAIQNQFSAEIRVKVNYKKKTKATNKLTLPRQEIASLPISTELDGFPNFHKLPTKADSILWVLSFVDSQNIESLTPKEVEFLTDKLRNKIPQNAFSPHNKRNIKEGYVSQADGKFKLQQKGIDHLKNLALTNTNEKSE